MKYIKTFEKFSDWLTFLKKKPVEIPAESIEDPVVEIPVNWASAYDYKGKRYMLTVGDYTNKGIITKIIEDIHPSYVTPEGAFSPDKLTVFKGDPEDIKAYIDSKKYNI